MGRLKSKNTILLLSILFASLIWSGNGVADSHFDDWSTSTSKSIDGDTYSSIYVLPTTSAAAGAAVGMGDVTNTSDTPTDLTFIGGSIRNSSNAHTPGTTWLFGGETTGTGAGGQVEVIGGNADKGGAGGDATVQAGHSHTGTGGTLWLLSGGSDTGSSGNVIIGPENAGTIGSLTFEGVNEGTVGQCLVSTDAFGTVKFGRLGAAGLPTTIGVADGGVSTPGLYFTSETNSGLYRIGSHNWGLTVNGSEGIDLVYSSGGTNAGIGGPASSSAAYPLLINRTTVGATSQFQITNGDTTAGAGAKMQILADAGNNQTEVSTFSAATSAPDIYAGGRSVFRSTGAATGITLVADTGSGSDIRMYPGGDAIGNRVATFNSSGLTLGVAGTLSGQLDIAGSSSGTISINPQAAAGTYNFNLPITAGNAGQVLTSQGGGSTAMTWSNIGSLTNPMTTTGDIIYSSDNSGTASRLGAGTSGKYLETQGTSAAPQWLAFTAHTVTTATATGTTSGYRFLISGVTTLPTLGSTCTNNGHTFTIISGNAGKTDLWTTGASAPTSSGTLASCSTGDASITFSANTPLASYSTPSTAKAIWVRLVGGGGGGGGGATATNQGAAGGGGGGGGYSEKLITSPGATFYFEVGTGGGGGSSGNHAGTGGNKTTLISSDGTIQMVGVGGSGGNGSAATTGPALSAAGGAGGSATGGDVNVAGSPGTAGFLLATQNQVTGGAGGNSVLGNGAQSNYQIGASGAQNTTGSGGGLYGGGGGGGISAQNDGSVGGGNGDGGVLIIHEFYNGN